MLRRWRNRLAGFGVPKAIMRRLRRPKRADVLASGAVLIAVFCAVMIGALFLIETQFHPQGSPFGLPERIPACGRSYVGGHGTLTGADIEAGISPGFAPVIFEPTIGEIPLLAPFLAQRPNGMDTCDTVVFLQIGPDEYVSYGLEGGP